MVALYCNYRYNHQCNIKVADSYNVKMQPCMHLYMCMHVGMQYTQCFVTIIIIFTITTVKVHSMVHILSCYEYSWYYMLATILTTFHTNLYHREVILILIPNNISESFSCAPDCNIYYAPCDCHWSNFIRTMQCHALYVYTYTILIHLEYIILWHIYNIIGFRLSIRMLTCIYVKS